MESGIENSELRKAWEGLHCSTNAFCSCPRKKIQTFGSGTYESSVLEFGNGRKWYRKEKTGEVKSIHKLGGASGLE